MKNTLILFFCTVLLSVASLSIKAQQIDTAKENRAIRQLVKNYEDAWNRHDPKALAANYRIDAT
ncbi:hypothetical protein [Mucilaginibacter jinjuensis]|uniref:SnoaL-like protein n=1 Tax=Mucilaginibacter jinjuensis TaxID=1176721 RepID=A0ABY7T9P7_9SPHI|nr:hypothetical protein [Mucilaginibacter jinjuensis]WCT12958.1 hypothetical protein PQO05_03295 [Mucilaginibacter jinjuensis]